MFSHLRQGKIWIWIAIAIVVILVVGIVVGIILMKAVGKRVSSSVQKKFARLISPARKRFMDMLPPGYDRERAANTFDRFIEASRKGRIRASMAVKELAPYLQEAVSDGNLTAQEADSVLKLMEKVIIK